MTDTTSFHRLLAERAAGRAQEAVKDALTVLAKDNVRQAASLTGEAIHHLTKMREELDILWGDRD